MTEPVSTYRGRFAPSPTGPLHFGSLVAAVASRAHALRHQGVWNVRIDDLDPPREMPGAAQIILEQLRAFGLQSDEPVVYQSQQHAHYAHALETLQQRGWVYPCACTRSQIETYWQERGVPRHSGQERPYPGLCRKGLAPGAEPRAWRINLHATLEHWSDPEHPGWVSFDDALCGHIEQALLADMGDFVLKRADGLWAYHLAVVLDDAQANITHIVRGADLLSLTPRQIALQRLLGLPTPHYHHVPIARDAHGEKLSKQTKAPALDPTNAPALLDQAWQHLGGKSIGAKTVAGFWAGVREQMGGE